MLELLQESIKGYNLPFTLLLGVILIYWIVALLGVVDLDIGGDGIDFDVDADGIDGESDGNSSSLFGSVAKVIGLTDAPILMIISLLVTFLWCCNIIANMCFNPAESNLRASLLLIPVVVISFVATRLLVRPLRPVMDLLRAPEKDANIIGEQGIVRSAVINDNFGRVEIEFEGKSLLLNAVLSEGSEELKKGASVLVVSKRENSENYIVRPL